MARFLTRFQFSVILFALISNFNSVIAAEKSEPLVLEHADQLISSGNEGEIVNLVGNVHFKHDTADLFSKRATWYRKAGLVQFIDSVKVTDEERTILAQTVTYYRRDRRVTAVDNVRVIDTKQDVNLFCQRADYSRITKVLEAGGLPELVINPEDDTSRMVIKSLRMEYFADSSYGVAYDSVVITRRDMVANSGEAIFFRSPERAVLFKNPVIVQGQDQLSGDTISVFTDNRRISRLLVKGNALALYKVMPDTTVPEFTVAELRGREMEAFFANDKITTLVTRDNATSNYSPAVTDTLVRGDNIASGDSITLNFDRGTIKEVLISGGAQGQYIDPKFTPDGKAYFDTTHYSAKNIDYSFDNSEIRLVDNGELRFKEMTLNAGEIRYNTDTRILIAQGLGSDTAESEIQPPVLKQGTEELFGKRMSYNLDTRKGQVRMARTKFEGGYYSGAALRQATENVLLVSQGNYTSCDKEVNPHYHFHSQKMKMTNKDKVVARPVILYIGDLPVFAVPYYVFPIKKGRHSGFLTFEIGNFERGQRFVRNVGYYWALSEFFDLETSFDYYESSRTIFNGILRYGLRYRLTGNVGINYSRQSTWNLSNYTRSLSNRWRIVFSHNQTINPSLTLAGSGTFVSDKRYVPENVYDPAQRLNSRTIRSNGNLNKRWQSSSLVVNVDQTWNLDTDERRELLPSISFSRSSLPLFGDPSKSKRKIRIRPDEEIEEPHRRFYHSIYFSMSSQAQNIRNRLRNPDSTFYRKDYQTINSQATLSGSQNLLGVLSITPSINFTHSMVRLERSTVTDSLGLIPNKFSGRARYTLGVTAKTSVFGTVYPNVFSVSGLRHVMTPTVSYAFVPATKRDQGNFAYIGSAEGSKKSKILTYSLANQFQAKFLTGESEKKIDLFNLNFGGNYNFTADSLKIGNLSTTLRTVAIPKLDISYTSSHSFYDRGTARRRPLLQPRLTSMSIATTVKWGYHPTGESKGGEKEESPARQTAFGTYPKGATDFSDLGIDITLSHSYADSRVTGKSIKTQWLDLSTELQPTKNWRMAYNCRYNLVSKRIESQGLNIGRDLHCWQATFTWIPMGNVAGYYVRISIKSLPDIKIEESRGGLGGGY